jgi:hypothetical protein
MADASPVRALLYVPLLLVCGFAVLVTSHHRVLGPDVRVTLGDEAREDVMREHALVEAGLVARARQSFPGDLWSQGDDVANGERRWLAQKASFLGGVPLYALLPVLDEGIRASRAQGDRRGIVAPCMPRPFYD